MALALLQAEDPKFNVQNQMVKLAKEKEHGGAFAQDKIPQYSVPTHAEVLNFLLKDSLGGGGMASMNIDPQGKSYAQQLLEYEIPVDDELFSSLNKT